MLCEREATKTSGGPSPLFRDKADDHTAGACGCPQLLAPLVAPGDAVMIGEGIGEAVRVQPALQRCDGCIVLAGVAAQDDGACGRAARVRTDWLR
jgi:hypothetical protein